jgi:hypothetical protein
MSKSTPDTPKVQQITKLTADARKMLTSTNSTPAAPPCDEPNGCVRM